MRCNFHDNHNSAGLHARGPQTSALTIYGFRSSVFIVKFAHRRSRHLHYPHRPYGMSCVCVGCLGERDFVFYLLVVKLIHFCRTATAVIPGSFVKVHFKGSPALHILISAARRETIIYSTSSPPNPNVPHHSYPNMWYCAIEINVALSKAIVIGVA